MIRAWLDQIKGKAPKGAKRSSDWRKVRKEWIKVNNRCFCGRKRGLEVHHPIPFHIAPRMELEPSNLMTMCHRCHLLIGHLGNYRYWNVSALSDAESLQFKMREAKEMMV